MYSTLFQPILPLPAKNCGKIMKHFSLRILKIAYQLPPKSMLQTLAVNFYFNSQIQFNL